MKEMQLGRWSYCMGYSNDFSSTIEVGNFTSIAEGFFVMVGPQAQHPSTVFPGAVCNHPLSGFGYPEVRDCPFGTLRIGNDVWIGNGVCVVSKRDVTIGDGAIIGARAVVTRDVPAYAVVIGNPARIVRYRFEPSVIERLQQIQWWDWSDEEIRAQVDSLKQINRLLARETAT